MSGASDPTKKSYDSNLSRSAFLKLVGLTGASIGLFGLAGCRRDNAAIRLYASGTLDIGDGWRRLEQDLGMRLVFDDNGNDSGPIIANMLNGNAAFDYDIGGIQGGIERELALAKKILPWDLSKIPNWQTVWPWIKDIPNCKVDGKQYGLPLVVNADSIIYLEDKIGGSVDSYEVIFDPMFKGRTAMEDSWMNSVIFTAIYFKENSIASIADPGDLSESELGIVMEFLIKKKKEGQFRTFWRGWEDGVRLIKTGEVYAMTGWEPIVYEAQKAGLNAKYAVPREGYEGWSNDLILHVGAEERGIVDRLHEFANWELGGYYGCEIAKQRGYVVPSSTSVDYAKRTGEFDAVEQERLLEHVRGKFQSEQSKVYWQNTRPKNFKLYEEWWSKLRNA